MLDLLEGKSSSDYDGNSRLLQPLVGVHDFREMNARKPMGNYHDQTKWLTVDGQQVSAESLTYNFVYTGPAHQVVVTDTRSWRAYPNGSDRTPDLLPPDQITAQIPLLPDLGDRVLMVVVTTNAPPVQPIRGTTRHDIVSNRGSQITGDAHPDIFEAWEIPSLSFDRLLKRLSDKLKIVDGAHYGQAILMSGDVHFGFATRLVYMADNRYGDTSPQKALGVVAQLVGSSFKKQSKDTVGFQKDGYFYVPHSFESAFVREDMTEGYVGWNVAPGAPAKKVGTISMSYLLQTINLGIPASSSNPTFQIFPTEISTPVLNATLEWNLSVKPDYRYRLDYLLPNSSSSAPQHATPIPPAPAAAATEADRKAALATFTAATGNYRTHKATPGTVTLIGRNNLCEVTFEWGAKSSQADAKKVNHTVRWRSRFGDPSQDAPDPDLADTFIMWTTYSVDLDPKNPHLQPYSAATEP